jgi:hypothetical protein
MESEDHVSSGQCYRTSIHVNRHDRHLSGCTPEFRGGHRSDERRVACGYTDLWQGGQCEVMRFNAKIK